MANDITKLTGEITIVPALNKKEQLFIKKFSEMKHVKRHNGPYFVEDLIIDTLCETNDEVKEELEQNKKKTNTKKQDKSIDTKKKTVIDYEHETKKYPTDGSDIIDHDRPHDGKPGLWCRWTVNDEGNAIIWDGHEDFYNSADWLAYLINHFIGSQPMAKGATTLTFLSTHTLNGVIEGIEEGEKIRIAVKDNIVKTEYL